MPPYLRLPPLLFVPPKLCKLCDHAGFNRNLHVLHIPLCSYLDARDPALARLRQLSHSPAAWFRCPFAHVVLVSCLEVGAGAWGHHVAAI